MHIAVIHKSSTYSENQDHALPIVHVCLENLDLKTLESVLSRCNQIVHSCLNSTVTLNDRALIHRSMGHHDTICQDVKMVQILCHPAWMGSM